MPRPDDFHVYDTTLRDGAQREGISYSVADKLTVARLLDDYGVGFIEGGWPGAMPKDTEFFERARTELQLKNAELVAFGATRKAGVKVHEDLQVKALLDSMAPVITLVAKSDVRHVKEALRTTNEENLAMVKDTVAFLVGEGRKVFVDMEHFFDGYKHDRDYGVSLLVAAAEAGAAVGVMCDTNGGMLPFGMYEIVTDVKERSGVRLGIHCQDDTGCAIANSVTAVEAGVTHVQCTANGYGERTGNADLFVVVPNLQLKLGIDCLPDGKLAETVLVSRAIAEIANIAPNTHQPYAGWASFAHKAGLHASALKVNAELYNHIDPAVVGNEQNVLVTEMAGPGVHRAEGRRAGPRPVDEPRDRHGRGGAGEGPGVAGLDIRGGRRVVRAAHPRRPGSRGVLPGRVVAHDRGAGRERRGQVRGHRQAPHRRRAASSPRPRATVRSTRSTAQSGVPSCACTRDLDTLRLTDYKVRILDEKSGTGAKTRVLIGTTDGKDTWSTVGVHENVIAASWRALEDAVKFGLLRHDARSNGHA